MEKAEKEERELKLENEGERWRKEKNKEIRERGTYLYKLRKRDGGERMEPKVKSEKCNYQVSLHQEEEE